MVPVRWMRKTVAVLLTVLMVFSLLPALAQEGAAEEKESARPVLVDHINGTASPSDLKLTSFEEGTPVLEVLFPQILNCDAALLRCGGETMLIDCATTGQAQRILDMCRQLNITHIDKVVNTHPHEDHLGGFRDLIKGVDVDELWICFSETQNDPMVQALMCAERAGIPVYHYGDGDVFTLGGATLQVWQLEGDRNALNDRSAQMMVTFGERTLLMSADLEKGGQNRLVERLGPEKLKADILKYPHHGLEGLTQAYRNAVDPLFMVVTNNQQDREGLRYIRLSHIPTAWTVPGFVHLVTDGETWIVDRIESIKKY